MGVMRKALCAAVLGVLALPGPASAADATSEVVGAVGSELTLAVATPTAMTMTHTTAGTSSSLVTVTSTHTSWTLSIRDANPDTPGHMDRVTGTGPASLSEPLQWSLNGSGTFYDLSATPATVKTGSLVGTALVDFRQPLGAAEEVEVTDVYKLTATYTVI